MKEAGKNSFYTIIGIIQSLAFVQLMYISLSNIHIVQFDGSIILDLSLDNWILVLHSIIGFLIIIRLYSTMLFAIEDYKEVVMGVYELFLIFFIGTLEFYLFDSLDNFNPSLFYFRFSVFAIFSLVGYSIALTKVLLNKNMKNDTSERNLQLFNNIGGVIALIIIQMIVLNTDISKSGLLFVSILCCLILFANTMFSYKYSLKPKETERNE